MQETRKRLISQTLKFFVVPVLCVGLFAQAALPPQHQNSNDLNAMLNYVKASPKIMSGLQAIDLISQTVFYGDGCTAVFERLTIEKPAGWTGPADPLVIKEDSCPNYDAMNEASAHDHDMGEEDSITLREADACSIDVSEVEACKP